MLTRWLGRSPALADVPVRDAQDNPEIASAASYLAEAETEQAQTLLDILGHFAKLLPADTAEEHDDAWETWWTQGWVREFCRSVRRLFPSSGLGRSYIGRH